VRRRIAWRRDRFTSAINSAVNSAVNGADWGIVLCVRRVTGSDEVENRLPVAESGVLKGVIMSVAGGNGELRGASGVGEGGGEDLTGHVDREERVRISVNEQQGGVEFGNRLTSAVEVRYGLGDKLGVEQPRCGLPEAGEGLAEDEAGRGRNQAVRGFDSDAGAEREAEEKWGLAERNEIAQGGVRGEGVVMEMGEGGRSGAAGIAGVLKDERGNPVLCEQMLGSVPVGDPFPDAMEDQNGAVGERGRAKERGVEDAVLAADEEVAGLRFRGQGERGRTIRGEEAIAKQKGARGGGDRKLEASCFKEGHVAVCPVLR